MASRLNGFPSDDWMTFKRGLERLYRDDIGPGRQPLFKTRPAGSCQPLGQNLGRV